VKRQMRMNRRTFLGRGDGHRNTDGFCGQSPTVRVGRDSLWPQVLIVADTRYWCGSRDGAGPLIESRLLRRSRRVVSRDADQPDAAGKQASFTSA
jgi:hypothetical protein